MEQEINFLFGTSFLTNLDESLPSESESNNLFGKGLQFYRYIFGKYYTFLEEKNPLEEKTLLEEKKVFPNFLIDLIVNHKIYLVIKEDVIDTFFHFLTTESESVINQINFDILIKYLLTSTTVIKLHPIRRKIFTYLRPHSYPRDVSAEERSFLERVVLPQISKEVENFIILNKNRFYSVSVIYSFCVFFLGMRDLKFITPTTRKIFYEVCSPVLIDYCEETHPEINFRGYYRNPPGLGFREFDFSDYIGALFCLQMVEYSLYATYARKTPFDIHRDIIMISSEIIDSAFTKVIDNTLLSKSKSPHRERNFLYQKKCVPFYFSPEEDLLHFEVCECEECQSLLLDYKKENKYLFDEDGSQREEIFYGNIDFGDIISRKGFSSIEDTEKYIYFLLRWTRYREWEMENTFNTIKKFILRLQKILSFSDFSRFTLFLLEVCTPTLPEVLTRFKPIKLWLLREEINSSFEAFNIIKNRKKFYKTPLLSEMNLPELILRSVVSENSLLLMRKYIQQ